MIRYLTHNQINPKKWDKNILSPNSSILFKYEYLNLLTNTKWNALIYNDYKITVPLPYIKTNRKKIFATSDLPFITFLYTEPLDQNTYKNFLLELNKLNLSKVNIRPILKKENKINYTEYLALDITKNLKLKLKYKQVPENFHTNNSITIKGIIQFLKETNYKHSLSIDTIEKIINFAENNKDSIKIALYNELSELCAVGFFLFYNYKIEPLILHSKKTNPSYLELIIKALVEQVPLLTTLYLYPWLKLDEKTKNLIKYKFNFKSLYLYTLEKQTNNLFSKLKYLIPIP